ncbi:MAG: flavin reductase family protein [Pseudoclavibacter sp.]
MPMIAEARRRGIPFTLLYRGRTRSSMAFVDELEAYGPDVQLVPKDECGSLDIAGTLDRLPTGALVYCCGPERLVSALEAVCAEAGRGTALRVERFSARPLPETAVNEFDVELAASGRRLSVPHDRTLLEVLRDADVDIPTSCEEGTCGSCESEVLCGRPDHRDSVLTDEEREQGDRMMVCVSRSRSPLLILNL